MSDLEQQAADMATAIKDSHNASMNALKTANVPYNPQVNEANKKQKTPDFTDRGQEVLEDYLAAGDIEKLTPLAKQILSQIDDFSVKMEGSRLRDKVKNKTLGFVEGTFLDYKKVARKIYEEPIKWDVHHTIEKTGKKPKEPLNKVISIYLKNGEVVKYMPAGTQLSMPIVTAKRINLDTAPTIIAICKAQGMNPIYVRGNLDQRSILWLAAEQQNYANKINFLNLQNSGDITTPQEQWAKIQNSRQQWDQIKDQHPECKNYDDALKEGLVKPNPYPDSMTWYDALKEEKVKDNDFVPIIIGGIEEEIPKKYRDLLDMWKKSYNKNNPATPVLESQSKAGSTPIIKNGGGGKSSSPTLENKKQTKRVSAFNEKSSKVASSTKTDDAVNGIKKAKKFAKEGLGNSYDGDSDDNTYQPHTPGA